VWATRHTRALESMAHPSSVLLTRRRKDNCSPKLPIGLWVSKPRLMNFQWLQMPRFPAKPVNRFHSVKSPCVPKIDISVERGNNWGTTSAVHHGFRLLCIPADSSQVFETTFRAAFDSFRAHHILNQLAAHAIRCDPNGPETASFATFACALRILSPSTFPYLDVVPRSA